MPSVSSATWHRWLGARAAIWPLGIPLEPLHSLVSSRLPRALDEWPWWFERLRRELFDAAARGRRLICVAGTAIEPHLRHASTTLGIRLVDVRLDVGWQELLDFVHEAPSPPPDSPLRALSNGPRQVIPLWLTPCVPERTVPCLLPEVPPNDKASVLLGATVAPLFVRRRGLIDRLLDVRRAETGQPASWRFAIAPHSCPRAASNPTSQAPNFTDVPLPWPALIHCVRRHDGPWAGQSHAEFLDELLWELPQRDRSSLATLSRIVCERRLRASSAAIRGGSAVVCFSACSLTRLASLRRYQPHRRRWDFEPYGLAIRREWLEARGAKPVRYGDDAVWNSLAIDERPWFQRQSTRLRNSSKFSPNGTTHPALDWTIEEEWRVVGDVDLSTLSPEDAVLFVADEHAASRLRQACRWPIVALRAYTIGNPGD